jgi:tetratricopeptide (TPR) repeat protein
LNAHHSRSRACALLAALPVALAVAAYVNSVNAPFTFDDHHEIITNQSIEDLAKPGLVLRHGLRPLTNLSYAVDYALWSGRDAFGFHVSNVVFHAANVLMLFVLTRRLVRDEGSSEAVASLAATLAAALFAVHPMMTEAVSYVSSRSELLVTLMVLSSVYAFRRGVREGPRWFALAFGCFLLALAAKETGAIVPLVVFAADVLYGSGPELRSRIRRFHAPVLALVVVGGFLRSWRYVALEVPGAESAFTWQNAATVAHIAVRYIWLLVAPHGQSVIPAVYPIASVWDARLILVLVALSAIVTVAFKARRRAPLVTFGLIWFVLGLVPSSVLGVLAQTGLLMAEHRVYLSSCGFFMAAAAFMVTLATPDTASSRRLIPIGGAIATLVFVFLYLTIQRNRVWEDPIRLWQEAARLAPDTPAAYLGLGNEYRNSGQCEMAERAYRRTIELSPVSTDAYLGEAACLLQASRVAEAHETLRRAMTEVPPNEIRILLALASMEESSFQRPGEAVRLCQQALAIQPDSADAADCVRKSQMNARPERR